MNGNKGAYLRANNSYHGPDFDLKKDAVYQIVSEEDVYLAHNQVCIDLSDCTGRHALLSAENFDDWVPQPGDWVVHREAPGYLRCVSQNPEYPDQWEIVYEDRCWNYERLTRCTPLLGRAPIARHSIYRGPHTEELLQIAWTGLKVGDVVEITSTRFFEMPNDIPRSYLGRTAKVTKLESHPGRKELTICASLDLCDSIWFDPSTLKKITCYAHCPETNGPCQRKCVGAECLKMAERFAAGPMFTTTNTPPRVDPITLESLKRAHDEYFEAMRDHDRDAAFWAAHDRSVKERNTPPLNVAGEPLLKAPPLGTPPWYVSDDPACVCDQIGDSAKKLKRLRREITLEGKKLLEEREREQRRTPEQKRRTAILRWWAELES